MCSLCPKGRYHNPQRRRRCRPLSEAIHNPPPTGGYNPRAGSPSTLTPTVCPMVNPLNPAAPRPHIRKYTSFPFRKDFFIFQGTYFFFIDTLYIFEDRKGGKSPRGGMKRCRPRMGRKKLREIKGILSYTFCAFVYSLYFRQIEEGALAP